MEQIGSPRADAKRFLWIWLLVLALLGGVIFPGVTLLTLEFPGSSEAHWVDQLYARKQRAVELRRSSEDKPILLTFGGSAGLFGVNAKLLEEQIGTPTVNFNTHGALGLDYHLARLRRTARRGDTALLVLETSTCFRDPAISHDLLKYTVWTYDRAHLAEMSWHRLAEFLYLNPFGDYADSLKIRLRRSRGERVIPARVAGGYGYLQLSANGDFIGPVAVGNFASTTNPSAEVHPGVADALQKAVQWCRKNGVQLRLAASGVCRPEPKDADRRRQQYAAMDALFKELGLEVWGRASESEYPRELFRDTPQHLTTVGRRLYTERLIETRRRIAGLPEAERPVMFLLYGGDGEVPSQMSDSGSPQAVKSYYVSQEPLGHRDCVAVAELPAFLRETLHAGTRIQFSNPALAPIITAAGFSCVETGRREATLADWQRRHPQGVFLLANVDSGGSAFPPENLPTRLRDELKGKKFRTAIVGPGILIIGEDAAPLSTRLDATPEYPFSFDILLRSSPLESLKPGESPIRINNEPIGSADAGLGVAVLDRATGIVVAKGTFTSDRIVESRVFNVTAP